MIGTLLANALDEIYPGPPERHKVTLRLQPDPSGSGTLTPQTIECWDGDADLTGHLLLGDKVTLGSYLRWSWQQRFEGDAYYGGNRVVSCGVSDYSRPLP